jgi:hypothetical protein
MEGNAKRRHFDESISFRPTAEVEINAPLESAYL